MSFALEKSAKKGTPGVIFSVLVQSAFSDVDEDELAAMGGVEGAKLRLTFWLTADSTFRLKEFAQDSCGVATDGLSTAETIEACLQVPFIAQVTHRPDPQDASKVYTEIGKTTKIPA
ncbi:MAG: hypothetical protein ACRDAM_02760 [Casimicrobium sp.]